MEIFGATLDLPGKCQFTRDAARYSMTSIVNNKQTMFIVIISHEIRDMLIELELCALGGSKAFVLNIEVVLVLKHLAQFHDLFILLGLSCDLS